MHIITTGYRPSWPESLNNSILLGDWCIKEDSEDINELNKLKSIDYHFNDRKTLNKSREELNNIYNELLKILSFSLNKLFKKNNNRRYWEIIFGYWLYTFTIVLYDRYFSVKKVINKHPKYVTNVLDQKSYAIASTSNEFFSNIQDDYANFQIYSSLWVRLNGKIDSIIKGSAKKSNYNSISYFHIFTPLIKFLFKKSKIITFHTGFSKKLLFKIILKSRFRIIPFEIFPKKHYNSNNKLSINSSLREKLNLLLLQHKKNYNNEFLNLCLDIISENVPLSILEGYEDIVKFNSHYINKSKNLLSSKGFTNDIWNIFCAENIKNGAKLINMQHGGGYGIQLFGGFQDYEINISDLYITTGWKLKNSKKFIVMPSPIFNDFNVISKNKKHKILFIANDYPRYFYRMFSHPIGKYVKIYRNWQHMFFNNINDELISDLTLRLYSLDYAGTHSNFKKKYLNIKFDDFSKSFEYQLTNCKVAISDTNQTTYLQSLALNIPTIVFWNPISSEISEKAKPYINMLKKVKILHNSPKSAANFINLNYHSIDEWWMSDDVQNARISFIKNYAIINNDWETDWINLFKELVNSE